MWGVIIGLAFLATVFILSKLFDRPVTDAQADGPKQPPPKRNSREPLAELAMSSLPAFDVPIVSDFDRQRDILAIHVDHPPNPQRQAQVLLDALRLDETPGRTRVLWQDAPVLVVEGQRDLRIGLQLDAERALCFDRHGRRIARDTLDVVLILRPMAAAA